MSVVASGDSITEQIIMFALAQLLVYLWDLEK